MSATKAHAASFVREKMLPEKAPPGSQLGSIGWARQNLFSGWFNSILTVVSIYVIYSVL